VRETAGTPSLRAAPGHPDVAGQALATSSALPRRLQRRDIADFG